MELEARRVGESHNLGTSEFLVFIVLGIECNCLALERVGHSRGCGSRNMVHDAGEMWIGVETEGRRSRHLAGDKHDLRRVSRVNIRGSWPLFRGRLGQSTCHRV